MGLVSLKTTFVGLSGLGFFLLWVVMGLNGSLEALFKTIFSAEFPTGRALKTSYTGIWPIDFLLCVLVVFFDGLNNLVDTTPYLMLLELVSTLFVINMMTLVESRRMEGPYWMRFPALWQYLWNSAGVAVFLPIYSLLYVNQGLTSASQVPTAEAQALPFTAVWSVLLALPLMLPAVVNASPFQIQNGVVIFFLTPPAFVFFHRLTKAIVTKTQFKASRKPAKIAYWIVGSVSALVHVGIAVYAMFSPAEDVSLSRIYIPHYNAVQRGHSDIVTEGALLFIQFDYVIINIVVLILGTYILCFEPALIVKPVSGKDRAGSPLLAFLAITGIFGAGAGLAFVLYCKEHWLDSADTQRKRT
ncbi:hypothetical protein F4821DRAFT_125767 [Hypoxylon rubiginosum]|uniref:Uncharacterized protein n=1 Tax=Hypoxylon rubiginosum TaxID=110542 RepID=A0ACC0D1N6_9PEZI|nr:hypothetical protein F4821DRAFT_125767 [Hypoxylon rubiginosum]